MIALGWRYVASVQIGTHSFAVNQLAAVDDTLRVVAIAVMRSGIVLLENHRHVERGRRVGNGSDDCTPGRFEERYAERVAGGVPAKQSARVMVYISVGAAGVSGPGLLKKKTLRVLNVLDASSTLP